MDWRVKNPASDPHPVAVIDIGSNSIRLVIYETHSRSPTLLLNEKLLCGLGRNRAADGPLNDDAVTRAMAIFPRFRKLCEQTGARRIFAFATEATRKAQNGGEFIRNAENALGCPIRVLSGQEEAELAAAGISAGFIAPDGIAGDLGGGSLELIDITGDAVRNEASLPLGSLALIENTGRNYAKTAAHIEKCLKSVDWLSSGQGRPFYIIGGTWRAVARLHMLEHDYPLSIMHHYKIPVREVGTLCSQVVTRNPKVPNLRKISQARQETLPYGLLLLRCLIDIIGPSEVLVSALGIREGMLYQNLSPPEQALDPLMSASEEMASRRARSFDFGCEFHAWTDMLFEAKGIRETAEEKRLRRAACYLSDIGWRGHPDYRGEKALGLIAQSAFVGVDHPGRAYLALAVYYGHEMTVRGDFSPALSDLAGRRLNRRAQILGAAARVAFKLSANMPGILNQTKFNYINKSLVLILPESLHMLAGEHVGRRLDFLAKLLKCQAELRIETRPDAPKSLLQSLLPRA